MTLASNHRLPGNGYLSSFQPWRLALLMMTAINLAAFWFLLQYHYSSEHYRAAFIGLGIPERVWVGISICATVVVVVAAWRNGDTAQRLVRAGRLATAVSLVVGMEALLGIAPRCLEPIVFSVAWGWAVVLWLRNSKMVNPEQTVSLRLGSGHWHPRIVNVLAAVVWIATAGLFFYYMAQQIWYLNNLALGYADCGDGARLMFNTLHSPRELFLRVNPNKPLFVDHVQPGILPLLPLWFLWPDLKLTILLQVLAVVGSAIPIYWIGRKLLLEKTAALLLVAAWLVFPSASLFIYSGSYGFRWGNLCVPLYFLALACWVRGRSRAALLFAVWAILIKEEAAIPIGMFGLYLVLFEKRRWLGLAIMTACFAYFLLVTSVIIPAMSAEGYIPQSIFFSRLGNSEWEIFLSPWAKPRVFWGQLLSPSTFYFAGLLLAPVLFAPLRRPSVLLVGSMVFLFDCLNPTLKSLCYWYQAALLPVVFWALAMALRTDDPIRQRATLSGAVLTGTLLSLFFGNTFWSQTSLVSLPSPDRLHLVQQMGRRIDRSGSLFATQRVAAQFITQKYLYLHPPVPLSIDYVLLDLRDSWQETFDAQWLGKTCRLQRQAAANPNLRLVEVEDGLLLYARHGDPLSPRTLVERDALPPDATPTNVVVAPGIKIVGLKIDPLSPLEKDPRVGRVRVTLFSAAREPGHSALAVRCALRPQISDSETDIIVSNLQPLGQGIWPIDRWLPDKVYIDEFLVTLPVNMSKQQFSVDIAALPLNE